MYALRYPTGGLGATIPDALRANLERVAKILSDGYAKARHHGRIDLMTEHDDIAAIYRQAEALARNGQFTEAQARVTQAFNQAIPWAKRVHMLSVSGTVGQEQAERGKSFLTQVREIFLPSDSVYVPEIMTELTQPFTTAATFTQQNKWVLPVAAGVLILLLLRK